MKKIVILSALFAACLSSVSANAAAVIDFNTNPINNYWITPVTSNGFVFSDLTGEGSLGTSMVLDEGSASVSNGTVHLMDWNNSYGNNSALSSMKMQAADSSLFQLGSFDFTSGYLSGSQIATQLTVTGYDTGNNAIASAVFSSAAYSNTTFTTLTLGSDFQNLSYVTFDAVGEANRVGYDNFNLAAVPEPSTYAMLLAGLGLMGVVARRRTQA